MGLASVRRSNGSYSFPVSRFHKGASSKVQGRNQGDQAYKPVLANELALRQPFPASVAPSLVTMRPETPHDPAVKLVEELADVGLAVILAPTSNDRVDLVDQLLRTDRSLAPGTLADLVLEVPDGFYTRNRIARSPANPARDLRGLQPERPLALFDLVAEKLEPVSDTDNTGFPGVQGHTQLRQYPPGLLQCRAGFPVAAARDQPIIGISSKSIAASVLC